MTVYNDHLSYYITELYAQQDEAQTSVLESIERNGLPEIMVKPEEGKFLQLLVTASCVSKAVEIGTLGGYSGLCIIRGLAPGGKLITLEKDPRHAQVARRNFEKAGVADRVEIRQGEAADLLARMVDEGPFDFVFIDADKVSYNAYLDWAAENLKVGGVLAGHNAFYHGNIANPESRDVATEAIREFNRRAARDPRLLATIYPGGDGMLVAVKVQE